MTAIEPWNCFARGIDFTPLQTEGQFQIWVGDERSPRFRIGPQEPAAGTLHEGVEFFFVQRCGMAVPGWHGACHLDDALLPDGTYRDATGGWHDAGDYNKYNGHTPLAAFSLLSTHRRFPAFSAQRERGGRPAALDEGLWGANWIAKMVDPDSGRLWRDVFSGYSYSGPPEDETPNVPGSPDARRFRHEHEHDRHPELAIATFCLAHELDGGDPKWRQLALKVWEAECHPEAMTPFRRGGGIFAALALERVTDDEQYGQAAAQLAGLLIDGQGKDGTFAPPHLVDQGLAPAALATAALEKPELAESILPSLQRYFDNAYARSDNPYGILQYGPNDYFFNYESPEAWYVGQNSMYLSQSWAAALFARLSRHDRPRKHAQDQIDWVLGRNPYGICMMEGAGSRHTARYHHRYDALPGHETGAVPGAITNGIVRESPERDAPRYDLREDERTWYQSNEPWIPHNAYYLLAASELALGSGPA